MHLKGYIRALIGNASFMKKRRERVYKEQYENWEQRGKPIPPPHLAKQLVVKKYAAQAKPPVFIETGTLWGEMPAAVINDFDTIYTIELNEELHKIANLRFRSAGHVTPLRGDSGVELPKLLQKIDRPALFWLDGHYSGSFTAKAGKDTPIAEELRSIFTHPVKEHIILIDDAHEFMGENDYPTLDELREFVMENRPDYSMAVEDNIIVLLPGTAKS